LKTVCRPTVFEGDPETVIYRMCHIGLPVYRSLVPMPTIRRHGY